MFDGIYFLFRLFTFLSVYGKNLQSWQKLLNVWDKDFMFDIN